MKRLFLSVFCICGAILFNASSLQTTNNQQDTILNRLQAPQNFTRPSADENSFASYLRSLPLKPQGSKVLLFDQTPKSPQNAFAVVKMDIGTNDILQSADAIVKLHAEYLWKQKRYNEIFVTLPNGNRIEYANWAEGNRFRVMGSKITWKTGEKKDYSYENFQAYLKKVFMFVGTASLLKETVPVQLNNMKIGDILIANGSTSHAMIVVDMVENTQTKQKMFALAQSGQVAQEIEIVNNPNASNSAWYELNNKNAEIKTPDFTFTNNQLYRFK